jgi:hypothetical protein
MFEYVSALQGLGKPLYAYMWLVPLQPGVQPNQIATRRDIVQQRRAVLSRLTASVLERSTFRALEDSADTAQQNSNTLD